ncbi:uncharacterized protein LOC121258655 [Juglans microcarpa x Juglans regia]|uniref:uncharacterized protein LOC121258655 n=1 Tax=Juglans microcarpa x Juglans regia TaxID=2249226 RepID=UPI001B7E1398|nr:uncharacterized protein LOC121258655 [Juglans microcarpa x Juglans regia]
MTSAKQVWDKLKERFAQPDEARIYHLQHKLSGIVQGHLSLSDYFTQLNAIWKELHSYRPLSCCSCGKCTCDALKNVDAVQQGDYMFKFLMGLNDSYDAVRGQIILLSPLPSMDKTFSLILQEERQRQARNTALPTSEPSALLAYQNFPKKKDRSDLVCHHCGKVGHTKKKCYKLVGFPPNFKFTKPRTGNTSTAPYSANHVAAQITASSHEAPAPSASQLNLSQAQTRHLMDLVNAQFPQLNLGQKPILPTLAPAKPDTTETSSSTTPYSNLAGNHHYLSTLSIHTDHSHSSTVNQCKHSSSSLHEHSNTPWIMDTGATDRMVCSTSFFDSPSSCIQAFVQLPNGTRAQVTHIGTVKLTDSLSLTDVLCVLSFTFNLISVSKLTQKPNTCLFFLKDLCFIQVLSSWMTIGLARFMLDSIICCLLLMTATSTPL